MTLERLDDYRIIAIRLENKLSTQDRCRLEREKQSIDDFVRNIKKEEIKSMVEMKYINSKRKVSWLYVAMKHGYLSENTPKNKIKKYLSDYGNCGF